MYNLQTLLFIQDSMHESIVNSGMQYLDYFNSFSCKAYYEYTNIRSLICKICIEGNAEIKILHHLETGEEKILAIKRSSSKKSTLTIEISLPHDGVLLVKVIPKEEKCKIYEAEWCTNVEPQNNVSMAIVFCTYKREQYVKRNVDIIRKYVNDTQIDCDVIVVDNGNTLKESDVIGATLIYNKNLGGSGGFSRGMLEALEKNKYSNVILMDDDVSFNPEIIGRMRSLLAYSKEGNLAIGAAMLCEDNPSMLYELGGLWDGDRLKSLYKNLDISDTNSIVFDNFNADYSAWWCCCIPVQSIKLYGLSMPFFIKNDDVEYGVRCGFKWAFLNGVAVWHASFDKKYSPHLEYYIKRNELISNCLNVKRNGFSQYLKIVRSVALQLVNQRYFAIRYIIDGAEDFLKGADYFSKIDAQLKNSELIASLPHMMTKVELESQGYQIVDSLEIQTPKKWKQIITLNGYLIPVAFYGGNRNSYAVVDMMHAKPHQFYKQRIVIQYNKDSDQGFVTKQKKGELFVWGWILFKLAFKFLFKYSKAKKSYILNHKKLSSIEYWKEIFDN